MKNIVVFITPRKEFYGEYTVLTRILIDNSLDLGWKPDDILIVTNFNYEYNGVRAVTVGDDNFCACRPRSIKTSIIPYLIDTGIVESDKIYWQHDLDAYQVNPMTPKELCMDGFDAGFTDYGWRSRWCLGSYFFKDTAKDIFTWMRDDIFNNIEDETSLGNFTTDNINDINTRIKKFNITYQIGQRNIRYNYRKAKKPIKVLHFHFHKPGLLDKFMYGQNEMNIPLMTDRLIKVFHYHGVKDRNYLKG
jgi:hypothetical protein